MTTPNPEPVLVVTVAEVARRTGLNADDDTVRDVITTAILDAQAAVTAYLGQPITPQTYTDEHRAQVPGPWHLLHHPVLEVLEVVAEVDAGGAATGLYAVTYRAGLDAAGDPALDPIRRYVAQHASLDENVLRLVRKSDPGWDRRTSSVTVEGQSVSYETIRAADTGAGSSSRRSGVASVAPGAPMTMQMLDYWRVAGRRTSSGDPARRARRRLGGW